MSISIYPDRAYYSLHDEVPLYLSLTAHASCAGRLYVAAVTPDGRYFFYNRERNALSQGDPFRMATWTPYETPLLSFSPGETITDLALWQGRLPAATYTVCAGLMNISTGTALSDQGITRFSIFLNRVTIVSTAIHVGDSLEDYMLGWETPEPDGTLVSARFNLGRVPSGAVLQGAYFATYFPTNRVYLNGRHMTCLPGAMNGNVWHRAGAALSGGFLRPGSNTLTFESYLRSDGHYDDYMVKAVELLYN
ncbi:MAG: hypothetical protein V1918_01770 [Planctomycetota bacterium]